MKNRGYVIERICPFGVTWDRSKFEGFCFEESEANQAMQRLYWENKSFGFTTHQVLFVNENKIGNDVFLICTGSQFIYSPYLVVPDYKFGQEECKRIEEAEFGLFCTLDMIKVLRR